MTTEEKTCQNTIIFIYEDVEDEEYEVYAVGEQSDLYDELRTDDISEAGDFALEWQDSIRNLNQESEIKWKCTPPGWWSK